MDTTTKRTLEFLLGPLMAMVVAAVSFVIVLISPLDRVPEIQHACFTTNLSDQSCVTGAYAAGILTLASFGLVIVAIAWATSHARLEVAPAIPAPSILKLFLTSCFVLILVHLLGRELAPAYASRIDELKRFSAFVSIENLLWPLLIQLLLIERDLRLRSAIIALLMLIMALTPYRAVTFAIFLFGLALPLAFLLMDAHRAPPSEKSLGVVAIRIILVAVIGCAIVFNGIVDSQARALTASPIARPGEPGTAVELSTMGRVLQRFAYPLYQAAIVRHLAETEKVPTILDELARKFRISNGPNLNEFAYGAIYPGSQTVGETTALYFGEGAAYFGKAGMAWALCAPLLLLIAWLLLGRMLPVDAILSLALWRSSFAGLITILPALFLQLLAIAAMTGVGRFTGRLRLPKVSRVATSTLLIGGLAAAAGQTWTALHDPQRRDLMRVEFVASDTCRFDMTTIGALPNSVDRVPLARNHPFRSSLTMQTPERVYLILPFGNLFKRHLSELIASATHFTRCETPHDGPSVEIIDVTSRSNIGTLLLEILALMSTLLACVLLVRKHYGKVLIPAFAQHDKCEKGDRPGPTVITRRFRIRTGRPED